MDKTQPQPKPRSKYFPWWVYNIMGLVFVIVSAFPGLDMGWRVVCSLGAFWLGLNTGIALVKRNRGLK